MSLPTFRLIAFAALAFVALGAGAYFIAASVTADRAPTLTSDSVLHLRNQDVTEEVLRSHFQELLFSGGQVDLTGVCFELQGLPPRAQLDYLGNHPAGSSLVIENKSDLILVVGVSKPGQRGDEVSRHKALALLLSECLAAAYSSPNPSGHPPSSAACPAPRTVVATEIVPPVIGAVDLGPLRALHVDGNYAYVSGFEGCIFIVDVSNPARPVVVGSARTQGDASMGTRGAFADAFGLRAAGDYLYLAATSGGLQIMDVRNRAAPRFVSQTATATQVREIRLESARDVAIDGDVAYVASTELKVIDIKDRTAPAEIGSLLVFGYGGSVDLHAGHAYLTTDNVNYDGAQIVDVRDPRNPVLAGSISTGKTPASRTSIAFSGAQAFVLGGDRLHVADISNPRAPVVLGSVALTRVAEHITAADGFVYVTVASEFPYGPSTFAGLLVFDVRTPSQPLLSVSLEFPASPRSAGKNIQVVGNLAYVLVGEQLQVIDLLSLIVENR